MAEQIDGRDTGRDARFELTMRLIDRRGRVRERALTMTSLDLARAGTGSGDRLLLRFTAPADLRGTSFLVWDHRGAEDERFLFLPALGRTRRIAGAEAQESFVGTDFSYEEIGGRELDDYAYALVDASASWNGRDVYLLESRARDTGSRYPRTVSSVLKDSFVVARAEIFNRRDEREKVYEVGRLDRVEGIWTVMASSMENVLEGSRTELVVEAVDYGIGLTEADFSRRVLERNAP